MTSLESGGAFTLQVVSYRVAVRVSGCVLSSGYGKASSEMLKVQHQLLTRQGDHGFGGASDFPGGVRQGCVI